jgi:glycosyltransferase involved in cell wall biosynthesis
VADTANLELSAVPQVFINGRFLEQRVTGIQRYARETLLCLDESLGRGEGAYARWTILVPRGTPTPRLRHIGVDVVGHLHGHLWEQLELPWRTRNALLFSFGLTGPLAQRRQIITVHDANVIRAPEAFRWQFRLWYRFLVPRLVARSPCTIAVSRFSAREAEQCYGAAHDCIRIATEGWQHLDRVDADYDVLDCIGVRSVPFALAVSSPTANKNFAAIARALAILGSSAPRCVVAGSAAPGVFGRSGVVPDSIVSLGYVTDGQLKALYQSATCFIFPSFYEGFGIPPLEAMSCGCPVLASTAPALREVCGDAALYFDPNEPQALAARLREVFGSAALRSRMADAGLKRARLYSWMESARLNLEYIQECVRASDNVIRPGVSCHA